MQRKRVAQFIFIPKESVTYIALYVFVRGDCFIRLVYTYLRPIKAHDHPAYFGFVSKSRVNHSRVREKVDHLPWKLLKSAKTRNRDNPISNKCGGRLFGLRSTYVVVFFFCFFHLFLMDCAPWQLQVACVSVYTVIHAIPYNESGIIFLP